MASPGWVLDACHQEVSVLTMSSSDFA